MITVAMCALLGDAAFTTMSMRQAHARPSEVIAVLVEEGWSERIAQGWTSVAYGEPARLSDASRLEAAEEFRNHYEADCISRLDGPVNSR